ncbi:MAG: metallophosphoesterase [Melioribacteraceae bacterium]|nr:metallophosphoesterase [Melioribacteraceae bacterium]
MKVNKIYSLLLSILIVLFVIHNPSLLNAQSENVVPKDAKALTELGNNFTFMIASDLGRNGYYDQKPIAEMMGEVTVIVKPKFVAAVGDIHHFMGVRSVQDPLWLTNFEWIYKHPSLMIPWYPVLGNHEYEGSTQAVLDYKDISRRWEMYSRYYAKTLTVSNKIEVLILFIDTTPLIDKYRVDSRYFDAGKQSMDQQLAWIDSTLRVSNAKWKIVLGHHPIYSGTTKSESEREDLQKRLKPILDRYNIDITVAGHIHNFQHIKVPGSNVDYFVNSSASLAREVIYYESKLFGSPESGFTLCTIKDSELIITFVNKEGGIIYQYVRRK